ncbi:MAG: type II toxin-antitoxin system HicB family antitoxin [Alphaproteobacteria bacterium]|nr:type II toxin-antitoxin system HicB family antitoxin [Alphaproteobacteria bacterium]
MDRGYPIVIILRPDEEGGGFSGYAPDLGCTAGGNTREEAVSNAQKAIVEWCDAARERGLNIPEPNSAERCQKEKQISLLQEYQRLDERLVAMENRLLDIERLATELEERLDHLDASDRAASLAGGAPLAWQRKRLLS